MKSLTMRSSTLTVRASQNASVLSCGGGDSARQALTRAVVEAMERTPDPRLREVLVSFVKHLFAFARDVRPTFSEWEEGINFLVGVGHATDDKHNEAVMMSDTFGFTTLIGLINRTSNVGTEAALLGPFWRLGVPDLPPGAMIAKEDGGSPGLVRGVVRSVTGEPLPDALVDVWQCNHEGLYDNQIAGKTDLDLRGRFRTDGEGRYAFRTTKPVGYPVPTHGPAGQLILKQGRHAWRPAHIHTMVSAPAHETLITQIFVEGDEYLEKDSTFSVMPGIVGQFQEVTDPSQWDEPTEWTLDYDFVLREGEPHFPPPPIQ